MNVMLQSGAAGSILGMTYFETGEGASPMHHQRRKRERVRVGGSIRLMIDTPDGLRIGSGRLVDLSERGCAIFTATKTDERAAGRIQLEFGGTHRWLPVVVRWSRCDTDGWTIGCVFDRPTDEKQRAIRSLVWERRNLVKS